MTGFEIFTVVMLVVSCAMSVVSMMMMPGAQDQDDVGVDLPDAGANKSLDFMYGRARVVGNKVFEKVGREGRGNAVWWNGLAGKIYTIANAVKPGLVPAPYVQAPENSVKEGDWLTIVAAAGQGPCNALKQIYINGSPALTAQWERDFDKKDASHGTIGRDYIEERFRQHLQIQFNTGAQDFHYQMVTDLHPEWDASCIGHGIPSVALRIRRDSFKGEIQGEPQIEVEMEGRLIRDIRRESAELAYDTNYGCVGTNPALCMLDYATSPFGMNLEYDDIDLYSIQQMANDFDKKNVKMNGVLDQKNTVAENIKKLQSDFFCTFVKTANKWRLISWQPDTISEHFDVDDIADKDINFKWSSSKASFNRLEVEYADAKKGFQKDILVYPSLTNDELIARDGNVTTKKVEAKFTTSKDQIDQFASTYYETMRKMGVLVFNGFEKAYDCEVGDVVTVTHPKLQFNKKLFRVVKIKRSTKIGDTATAELTLAEYNAAAFDLKHISNEGQGTIEPPRVIQAPKNLKFNVAKVADSYTGQLCWNRVECYDFLEYVVEYKLSSQPETEWTMYGKTENNEIYILDLHGAYYDFRVFTRTKFRAHSAYSFLYKVDVQDDTILPKVTGLKLITTNKDITVTDSQDFTIQWDSMDDVEVKADLQMMPNATTHQTVKTVKRNYEVEISHGNTYKETVYVVEPKFTYTLQNNAKNGLSRNVTFNVRIVSKGGAKSHEPAVLVCKNEQCKAPTGLDVHGSTYGITAEWIACTEQDYRGTRVYVNANKGYVPTDADLICDEPCSYFQKADIKRQVWYVHVAHYDAFGVDELQFSPEIRISPSNVVDEMTDMREGTAKELADAIRGVTSSTDTKVQAATKAANDALVKAQADNAKALQDGLSGTAQSAQTKLDAAKAELNKAIQTTQTDFNTKLQKEITDRGAAVQQVQKVITDLDTKVAADIKALKAQSDAADAKHTAAITDTNTALTNKEKALVESVNKLKADSTKALQDGIQAVQAEIEATKTALTTADTATTEDIKKLRAEVKAGDASNTAEVQALTKVVTDKDAAMTKRVDALTATSNANDAKHTAAITDTNTALTTKEKALTERINALTATSNANDVATTAKLEELRKTSSTADTALAEDIKKLRVDMVQGDVTNKAQVDSVSTALSTKETALAKRIDELKASSDANDTKHTASISAANTAITDTKSALAESTKKLESSINGVNGVVQTQAKTIATMDGEINNIQSQYTISVQSGNKFAGISLIGKSGTVTSSTMAFGAEQMLFWDPEAKNNKPFMEYREGKLRMVNAYIDDIGAGQIRAGAISADHIQGESIEAKHIKAGFITTDKLRAENGWITNAMIGNVIQSHNFSLPQANKAPKSGWQIDKGGNIYASNLYASGQLEGAVLRGCLIEAGNVIIQGGVNNILTVTDADKWNGKRYLCREAAGLNAALAAPTNGTIAQTQPCGVVPYNYDAAGFTNVNGELVSNNYERTKKAHVQPDINIKVQVITAYDTRSYDFNLQLIDANGQQIANVAFSLAFDWTYISGRHANGLSSRPQEVRFTAQGYNGVAKLDWSMKTWEQCSGSNGGDHQQTCYNYEATYLGGLDITLTKAGAPTIPYQGNYSGCSLRCTCTTAQVGATWAFNTDKPWEKPPKHVITQLAMSDTNSRY